MDFFTHILIGMFSGVLILDHFGLFTIPYVLFIGTMAAFPDLDSLLKPLSKRFGSYYLSHKAASHSYIICFLISGITSWIFSIIIPSNFWITWLIGFLSISLHVSLDAMTTSLLPAFYPITKKEYRMTLDRAVNPFLLFFSSCSAFIFFLLFVLHVQFDILYIMAIGWLLFYFFYFSLRILIKTRVRSKLEPDQTYLPGNNPFNYLIYTKRENEKEITYRLDINRFRIGITNKFDIKIKKGSIEWNFLTKALEISKKYRFFSKWQAMIPLINIKGDTISVLTLLAEPFSGNRAYFVKTSFEIKTEKIIEYFDGFNYSSYI